MKKIKDFLMVFGIISILLSVGVGLGTLFGQLILYFVKLFPENLHPFIFFGTVIATVSLLSYLIIKEK